MYKHYYKLTHQGLLGAETAASARSSKLGKVALLQKNRVLEMSAVLKLQPPDVQEHPSPDLRETCQVAY